MQCAVQKEKWIDGFIIKYIKTKEYSEHLNSGATLNATARTPQPVTVNITGNNGNTPNNNSNNKPRIETGSITS